MLYLLKLPVSTIIKSTGLSSTAVTELTHFLRQLLGDSLEETSMKIGGDGIIVEIDETKMGKRKYYRGHKVDVVCGVERTREKKYFAIEVANRNGETSTNVIKHYVNDGSIVFTDMWSAYKGACENFNFELKTVNHSKFFEDPVTGVNTNSVEGFNNGFKTLIFPRNRTQKSIHYYLLYYIWRKQNSKNIRKGFISSLKKIYYK